MGLSTHVLDTMHGKPAVGMTVTLFRIENGTPIHVHTYQLNKDGRTDTPLYTDGQLNAGQYRLTFDVNTYFEKQGVTLPQPPFLDTVSLDFGIANIDEHYHVPLLVSPWTYSTYRGS